MSKHQRSRRGQCHICGQHGELSFEHVPPAACFNSTRIRSFGFFDWHQKHSGGRPKGTISQRGLGGFTLCPSCNSKTGAWYGSDFVQWTVKAIPMWQDISSGSVAVKFCAYRIYPLRILKQIVSMMLSIGSNDFIEKHPEFTRFLLEKRSQDFPEGFRIGLYIFKGEIERHVGLAVFFDVSTGAGRVLSDITGRPFGYMMHVWGRPLDDQRYIEDWSKYGYEEQVDMRLCVPVHLGDTPYPGVYRNLNPESEQ